MHHLPRGSTQTGDLGPNDRLAPTKTWWRLHGAVPQHLSSEVRLSRLDHFRHAAASAPVNLSTACGEYPYLREGSIPMLHTHFRSTE